MCLSERGNPSDDPEALREAAAEQKRDVPPDLKKLFRQVAKAVHPDLAADEEDRRLREELMRSANAAYERGDVEALQAILVDWESHPQSVKGDGAGAELIRVIRAIHKVEERLSAIASELAVAGDNGLGELFDRAEEADEQGRDLIQEMADELDRQIQAARQKLADLRAA